MIIANIRNPTDLENKRRLQQQILELEVANEAELERRVKDFKDPNKPIPVAPQQKSNAELRKDRIENERQAIKNMEDIGFDYSRSAELVAWLSSSEVDKLADFNANFKGIKKELVETTNPKLLTTEYLKNYLERYFEDLDVSYGRKFAQQTQREDQVSLNVDDLIDNVPTPDMLEHLKNILLNIQTRLRTDAGVLTQQISAIDEQLSGETNRGQIKSLQREREGREKERELVRQTAQKGFILVALIDLYISVIPSPEFFATLKLALPINERTDLVRRYGRIFDKIKALNSSSTAELIEEAEDAGDLRLRQLLYGKMERALGFLTNKGMDLITSLNRNYENELARQGKEVELTKIKAYNDIQEKRKQEAEEAVKNYMKNPFVEDDEGIIPVRRETAFIQKVAEDFESGDLAREIESREDPAEVKRMDELRIERQLAIQQYLANQAQKAIRAEEDLRAKMADVIAQVGEKGVPKLEKERADELVRTREETLRNMRSHFEAFINEIDELTSPKASVHTIKDVMTRLGVSLRGIQGGISFTTNDQADEVYNRLRQKLFNWYNSNRIIPLQQGRLPADYDYDGSKGRQVERASIRTYNNANTNTTTQRGLGLKTALKSHFKDDEEELMDMAKALRKHKKKEAMIDKYAKGEDSSSEDEKGGALAFRHRRIKVGKGIAVKQKQPNYKTFGKYVIHMGHLIDKNIANFKYPSLGSIPSIRPLNISDDYKEFILDTIENEKPNERVLRKLPIEEQKHFERVVAGAGLTETFRIKRTGDEEDKKEVDRFNILRGEILAGNNNEKIVKELKGLIVKFINEGKIRRQEGLNMLMELSVI